MNTNQETLQAIAQELSHIRNEDIGLISGKMGAVIFFFHYARYTGNKYYEDIAMTFFDDVQLQLQVRTVTSYRHGVAGIGIAIDYLIENEFIAADEDILDDFDQSLLAADLYNSETDLSLYDGLIGYGWYWLGRLNGKSKSDAISVFTEIMFFVRQKFRNLSIKERFDVHSFLFELGCTPEFGKNVYSMFDAFRRNTFHCIPESSYPRLIKSPAGEMARKYLLNRYWRFDGFHPSFPMMDENLSGSKTLAWDGLYVLSVLSTKENAWIGLL